MEPYLSLERERDTVHCHYIMSENCDAGSIRTYETHERLSRDPEGWFLLACGFGDLVPNSINLLLFF